MLTDKSDMHTPHYIRYNISYRREIKSLYINYRILKYLLNTAPFFMGLS